MSSISCQPVLRADNDEPRSVLNGLPDPERQDGQLVPRIQTDQDYQPPDTPRGKAFAAALTKGGGKNNELFYEWTMPMS